jgi:SNF2 family DNA or RNA helicase
MSASHVPPSEELLGEAARRIGEAYPGLYAHQRTGVSFLLSRRRAILADDMGLGKTRQAIVAVREAAPKGPFLVICPAGVKLNWRREIGLVEDEKVRVSGGVATCTCPGFDYRGNCSHSRKVIAELAEAA